MKIALIGAGRIGQLHGTLIARQAGVDELIVNDVAAARAAEVAAAIPGARAVATPEEAMDAADAVIVAASTNVHGELVVKAADRGLPVFCEKPLAFDLEETKRVVEHVERRGTPVQVGFQRRFDPAYKRAKALVDSGDLGVVYMVRLIAHDRTPPPDAYIPTSGGLWRDSSIHDFDAIRWVTGQEVDEIYAIGSVRNFPIFAQHDDIDTGACLLTMSDGTVGVHGQTRHDPLGYDVRMEVVGSKDVAVVGIGPNTPIHSLEANSPAFPGPGWDSFLTRFEEAYRTELLAFLEFARGKTPSPCSAFDALQAMRVSVAATKSRAEHRPVRLSEI